VNSHRTMHTHAAAAAETAHGVETQCDLLKRAASPSDQGASLSELRLVSIAASLPGEVSAGSIGGLDSFCAGSDTKRAALALGRGY
jgi:hypothetical protein